MWDEEFRPGWADYPAAASLQNGTLRRRDCIRNNCFTLDRLPVAGALVCDWGDELLSWLLLTCLGDLPLCQLFNGIVCRAFHQKPSSFVALEHLNMTKYSAPHGKPAGWFYAKCDATQSKTKSRVNQTPPAAGRETGDLSCCDAWTQTSLHPLLPIKWSAGTVWVMVLTGMFLSQVNRSFSALLWKSPKILYSYTNFCRFFLHVAA